jgi:uncharacterized protein (DUF1800 family)
MAIVDAMGVGTAAHLLRRVGFGATAAELDEWATLPLDAAVDRLLASTPDAAVAAIPPPVFHPVEERRADPKVAREERQALIRWWLARMVAATRPLPEKLTWLWHDHFATSITKVKAADLVHRQRETIASLALGRFDALVGALVRDPAMLVWLDGRESKVGAPNENFARELFELFTLGHGSGHGGDAPYTEADVVDAARALTGWQINGARVGVLNRRRHDAGTKTVLGRTGPLGADDVVDLVCHHPAAAPHVVARLWSRIGRPASADDAVVVELASGFARDLDLRALLRSMLLHPAFVSSSTRTALLKTPVEWLVGCARALGGGVDDWWLRILDGLGQVPFVPPDVAGWPANEGWLSTSSAQVRLQGADLLVRSAGRRSDVVAGLDAVAPGGRADAAARLLGVERWSPATAAALDDVSADPRRLLTLALVAPETLLN